MSVMYHNLKSCSDKVRDRLMSLLIHQVAIDKKRRAIGG
jgi:hypothetical protein